jgi:hypothetical protein
MTTDFVHLCGIHVEKITYTVVQRMMRVSEPGTKLVKMRPKYSSPSL